MYLTSLFIYFLHIDRTSEQATAASTHPSTMLTTILLPTVKPEYEKIPTIKPVSDLKEKTTTMKTITMTATTATTTTTTASSTIAPSTVDMDTTSTIKYNRTTIQSPTLGPVTEASDELTTNPKIGMITFICQSECVLSTNSILHIEQFMFRVKCVPTNY